MQTMRAHNDPASASPDFLSGGGEMGERIRAVAWENTALGPPATWPQSLRVSIRIMLASRQPVWIGWGPHFIYFYNDSYKSILGGRHPTALGLPAEQVWPETWSQIGPMLRSALNGEIGTYVESQLLIMERNAYPEETYYTWSYTPIPDGDGRSGGIFCANTEDTRRVIGERQLALLRELSVNSARGRTTQQACEECLQALKSNPRDLPFALIYLPDSHNSMVLTGTVGIARDHPLAPTFINKEAHFPWPMSQLLSTQAVQIVPDLREITAAELPTGAWDLPPTQAVLVPIKLLGTTPRCGTLIVGLNRFRLFDEDYRSFLSLIAGQVAAALGNAEAHESERRRADALAEVDRAKTVFFSNVSHEFRTPLTLMLGPLDDLISNTDLSPVVHTQLQLVKRNSQRLNRLVNSLLEFSRIEAGRVQATYEPTDLSAFTRDLCSAFRSALERAGLFLSVDCPTIERVVHVDHGMWEKIVLNLLSNAFKFTFEGGITVKLRAHEGNAVLSVKDTGVGIAEDEQRRIFERFRRVEGARSRTSEGSGIGLALVQELVKLHGGGVEVASLPGKGSCFTVKIPFGTGHLAAENIRTPRGEPPVSVDAKGYAQEVSRWVPSNTDTGISHGVADRERARMLPDKRFVDSLGARILLADDNADMRSYLSGLLGRAYAVECVADGEQALAAARRNRPELILSDVMMPVLDGFGLIQRVREDRSLSGVPVVLISARAGEEERVDGLSSGADDYITKPFSTQELMTRVGAIIERGRAQQQILASEQRYRRLADQFSGQNAALEQSTRQKDEFLAMLAHELRNPLAPIRHANETLSRLVESDDPRVSSAISVTRRQLDQLSRLVDELLDVSRVTRGQIELKRRPTILAQIVGQALEAVDASLQEKEQQLSVSTGNCGRVYVEADPARLMQCLINVLNNAIKFTPVGGHIRVQMRVEGTNSVLEVTDNGIGMAADVLPHIFDLFVQAAQPLDRSGGGLGIGLAVVKRVVEMHGGEITAQSAGVGQGSTFAISLPVVEVPVQADSSVPEPKVRAARILIVDDNQDSADTLATLLQLEGHETERAYSAREALKRARTFKPEVVLLDIGLPEVNGYDVARSLRQIPDLHQTQIIAVTGYGQPEDRARAMEAGFDVHLVKPLTLSILSRALSDLDS
jgi:signal transduction histidine kinase